MSKVHVEMTAEDRQITRSFDKVVQQQQKMLEKFRDVGREARKTGQSISKDVGEGNDKAFGSKAVGNLRSYATQMVSVGAAIGVVTAAMREQVALDKQALDTQRQLVDGRRRLVQISQTPEDFRALEARSDQLAAKYGVSRQVAQGVVFSGQSEGFDPELVLRASTVVSPETGASLAGQIPKLFDGADLTAKQGISLAIAAAEESRLDVETIGRALPTAAEGAAAAGASPAETAALLAVTSSKFGAASTAADRIKSIGTRFSLDERFRGGGIIAGVQQLQAMDEGARKEFLGESQELNTAYRVISEQMNTILSTRDRLDREVTESDMGRGILDRKIEIAETPETIALRSVARSETLLEQQRDVRALDAARFESIQNEGLRQLEEQGASGLRQFAFRGLSNAARFLGADPEDASLIAGHFATSTGQIDPESMVAADDEIQRSQRRMTEQVERAAAAIERLERAANRTSGKLEQTVSGGVNLQPTGVDR